MANTWDWGRYSTTTIWHGVPLATYVASKTHIIGGASTTSGGRLKVTPKRGRYEGNITVKALDNFSVRMSPFWQRSSCQILRKF